MAESACTVVPCGGVKGGGVIINCKKYQLSEHEIAAVFSNKPYTDYCCTNWNV